MGANDRAAPEGVLAYALPAHGAAPTVAWCSAGKHALKPTTSNEAQAVESLHSPLRAAPSSNLSVASSCRASAFSPAWTWE